MWPNVQILLRAQTLPQLVPHYSVSESRSKLISLPLHSLSVVPAYSSYSIVALLFLTVAWYSQLSVLV